MSPASRKPSRTTPTSPPPTPEAQLDAQRFEELCCELAYASVETPAHFLRIDGRGGDGGLECIWTDPSTGEVHGWQAKYNPDLTRALEKCRGSLLAARARYPALARFVICLPFDLAGSRGSKGQSQQDRFEAFKVEQEAAAQAAGQRLRIELWSDFTLRARLRNIDPSGGRFRFYFDRNYLSPEWFSKHIDAAFRHAGPRYTPKLHHGHALDETLAALGDTDAWRERCASWRADLRGLARSWASAVASSSANNWSGAFPVAALTSGEALREHLRALAETFDPLSSAEQANIALSVATCCADELARDLDAHYGRGAAGSVSFRQRRAELDANFPAGHLDECRRIGERLEELTAWLAEPAIPAARDRVLVLTGPAGIGKTHGLCDVAARRRAAGLLTLLVFGKQLSGPRTLWEELAAALDLVEGSWSREALLDALDSAGFPKGRVVLCVDALDERADRHRWKEDLPELVDAVRKRPRLALCVSVRDVYRPRVIREDLHLRKFVHPGFGDDVFGACAAFFAFHNLPPPTGPLLEPELANPLFLKLLCEMLIAKRLTAIPRGWRGAQSVLQRLLRARDEEIELEHPALGNNAVSSALLKLAAKIPEGGTAAWCEADRVVTKSLPLSQRGKVDLLERMVAWGLLRRVPREGDGWATPEDRVDIAFGRLRHHLLAERLVQPNEAPRREALRELALADPGLAEALSLVMPERGLGELPDLAEDPDERAELLAPWLAGLPWRAPESLGEGVEELLNESFVDAELLQKAWDALVSLALRPGHAYDHRFFHAILASTPLPRRDAWLCGALHAAFERRTSPLRQTLRAVSATESARLDPDLRLAWCVVLGWCGAAADLRVRDEATRAAVRLTEPDPGVWSELVALFADVDDDAVFERVLCAAYGTLLRNPDPTALRDLTSVVVQRVLRRPLGAPANALIRGHAQCIGEWAAARGVLPEGLTVDDFQPPYAEPVELVIPTDESLKRYKSPDYPRLYASVMSEWTGDFAKYTLPFALRGYRSLLDHQSARRWVLGAAMDLGYTPSLHAAYDVDMLSEHGGGRGKPVWAERIGKKYQRIALARLVGLLDDQAQASEPSAESFAGINLRDFDPSVLDRSPQDSEPSNAAAWWAPARVDFNATRGLTEAAWVGGDDFPDPAAMVGPFTRPDGRWWLLDGHYQWQDPEGVVGGRRRDVWMMIWGFLVPRREAEVVRETLVKEDLMGRWLPRESGGHGGLFLGEYPWSPRFPELHEPMDSHDLRAQGLLARGLHPVATQLSSIQAAGRDGVLRLNVPSAELVAVTETRWDGGVGFRAADGRLVFQDPAALVGGPHALLVEADALDKLCERLDVVVVWAVISERRILGDSGDKHFAGMKHLCWTGWRENDGAQWAQGRGEHLRADRSRKFTRPRRRALRGYRD